MGFVSRKHKRRKPQFKQIPVLNQSGYGGTEIVMDKIISLCRNSEFQRLYRRGKSAVRPTMVMYKTKGKSLRLGITAGKKIGGAVCRNRAKRRIRELFRIHQSEFMQGLDICIVARTRILSASADSVEADFMSAAAELGILK